MATLPKHQAATTKTILKEGTLQKQQRGKKASKNLSSLKFQSRFVQLDTEFLRYYVSRSKVGSRHSASS